MKKYLEFVNEGFFGGKKPKRKYKLPSDRDMGELIDEIKDTFDPNKFSWSGDAKDKTWTYTLNGVKITVKYEENYSRSSLKIRIDNESVADELISWDIIYELASFFEEKEKEIKTNKNSELFNKTIKSRIDAKKYNL